MLPAVGVIAGGIALLSSIIKGNGEHPATNVGAASTNIPGPLAITGQGAWAGLSPATNQAGCKRLVNTMNDVTVPPLNRLGITAASTIFSLRPRI